MASEKEYKEIYTKFINYNQEVHMKNQKRIQVGLKVNILLPLVFLVLSFAIKEAKLVFLILWICTLFGIAFYLIYVEFSDYKMMSRLEEFGAVTGESIDNQSLIGEIIVEKANLIEERQEEEDNEEHH